MVNFSDIYASQIVYQDLVKAIPGFQNIEGRAESSFPKGESSIVLLSFPLSTPNERIEEMKKSIETPYPVLTQLSRELYGAVVHTVRFSVNMLFDYLKVPRPEEQKKGDFYLCIMDFEKGEGHYLSINHKQRRAVLNDSFKVKEDPNEKGKGIVGESFNFNLAEFHELVISDRFKQLFKGKSGLEKH